MDYVFFFAVGVLVRHFWPQITAHVRAWWTGEKPADTAGGDNPSA